jgi:hypothetical protein
MIREQAELRAERLRVMVRVLDALSDYEAGRYPEPRPSVSRPDGILFQTCSVDDRALAEACLDAQRDLLRRKWEALETLLGAIPPGGDLESIYEQPADRALPAIKGAQICGWLHEARA